MNCYQFRTNWLGQLVLQRLHKLHTRYGDREYEWRDARTQDLRAYYQHTNKTSNTREQFERECG